MSELRFFSVYGIIKTLDMLIKRKGGTSWNSSDNRHTQLLQLIKEYPEVVGSKNISFIRGTLEDVNTSAQNIEVKLEGESQNMAASMVFDLGGKFLETGLKKEENRLYFRSPVYITPSNVNPANEYFAILQLANESQKILICKPRQRYQWGSDLYNHGQALVQAWNSNRCVITTLNGVILPKTRKNLTQKNDELEGIELENLIKIDECGEKAEIELKANEFKAKITEVISAIPLKKFVNNSKTQTPLSKNTKLPYPIYSVNNKEWEITKNEEFELHYLEETAQNNNNFEIIMSCIIGV
jgi:hypothetical protein